jgi:hypothetical protein
MVSVERCLYLSGFISKASVTENVQLSGLFHSPEIVILNSYAMVYI